MRCHFSVSYRYSVHTFYRLPVDHNNNEPFWTRMHEMDLEALVTSSGFAPGTYFETVMQAKVDRKLFPAPQGSGAGAAKQEDYGRTPMWTAFGASKPALGTLPEGTK